MTTVPLDVLDRPEFVAQQNNLRECSERLSGEGFLNPSLSRAANQETQWEVGCLLKRISEDLENAQLYCLVSAFVKSVDDDNIRHQRFQRAALGSPLNDRFKNELSELVFKLHLQNFRVC